MGLYDIHISSKIFMVWFYCFEAVVLQHSVTANFVTLYHRNIHYLDQDDLWDGLCIGNFCLNLLLFNI